jgi:hypothetical protein
MATLKKSRQALACIVLGAALILPLSACSSSGPTSSTDSTSSTSSPTFSGTWATEYKKQYDLATKDNNSFAQQVLQDGTISESEMQEGTDSWVSCMTEKGYTIASRDLNGAGDTEVPDSARENDGTLEQWDQQYNTDDEECLNTSGLEYIQVLWLQEKNDPDKKNDVGMVISCLRKHQVVDDTVTDEEVEKELTSSDGPFPWVALDTSDPNYDSDKTQWLSECTSNPREFK